MTLRDSSTPVRLAMIGLATVALVGFLAILSPFHLLPSSAPPIIHVIMAIGIMPLIMGAMIYFTPVLTRTRMPSWPMLSVPMVALMTGIMATSSLVWRRDLLFIPAVLAISATGVMLAWMWRRTRTMLGRPHPGQYWYLGALGCLLWGLTAIFVATQWPEYWTPLRRFHVHVNILGFVGLTAFGTLRVLLPTAARYTDPVSRGRLQGDLYPVLFGTLLISLGSAWWTWLVWPGLVLWLVPLARFAWPLVTRWRRYVWGWHRSSSLLGFAVLGLTVVLSVGSLHALALWPATATLQLFFLLFLFPLVTGAIGYLLPVWLWPGRDTSAYDKAARRLAWGSGARMLVFFTAGTMTWIGISGGLYLAAGAVALFLLPVALTLQAYFLRKI
jgi:hypothetical protein